jgi:hypothetical protein
MLCVPLHLILSYLYPVLCHLGPSCPRKSRLDRFNPNSMPSLRPKPSLKFYRFWSGRGRMTFSWSPSLVPCTTSFPSHIFLNPNLISWHGFLKLVRKILWSQNILSAVDISEDLGIQGRGTHSTAQSKQPKGEKSNFWFLRTITPSLFLEATFEHRQCPNFSHLILSYTGK